MPEFVKSRATRAACTALCIAGYLPLSGCFFQKKPARAFVPPPPVAAKTPPAPQVLNLPEFPEDFAPEIESPGLTVALSLPPALPVKPTPPKTATTKPPATGEPTPPSTTPSIITPPKPQTILSADDRRRMNKELDDIVTKVRGVLDKAGGRNLPPDLAKLATDARTALEQAEQARDRDLLTAVSLAKRADFFANDLSARLP